MMASAFSATALLAAVWAFLADVDTGLMSTLRKLCVSPGALVQRQLAKREHVFREPLRLFVFANLVFFLIAPNVGLFTFSLDSLEASNNAYPEFTTQQQIQLEINREIYEERFNNHLTFRQPTFALLLVPMLALLAKLLDWRRPYGVHVMFALYAVSWILLSWPLMLWCVDTLTRVFEWHDPEVAGLSKLVLLVGGTLQWFVRAQSGGYARKLGPALLQGVLLTASWVAVMTAFAQVIFWLTYLLLPGN
ncbi:MAG: hypothetical protein DHS20C15_12830 [Planctomycetota bacterium]|nr:MAG: hypothetical protein DHS20C15_12830 [Planctomycetota bacterium]